MFNEIRSNLFLNYFKWYRILNILITNIWWRHKNLLIQHSKISHIINIYDSHGFVVRDNFCYAVAWIIISNSYHHGESLLNTKLKTLFKLNDASTVCNNKHWTGAEFINVVESPTWEWWMINHDWSGARMRRSLIEIKLKYVQFIRNMTSFE